MRHFFKIFAVLIPVLLGLSEEGRAKQVQEKKPKVEVVEGVKHVYNNKTPVYPKRTITLEEEFTYDGTDENVDLKVFKIFNYNVDQNGNIYFEESSDASIHVFNSEGKHIRTIGRRGQGPGEFEQPSDFSILPDGGFVALDLRSYRTSFFDPNGKYIKSHRWDRFRTGLFLCTDSFYISTLSFEAGSRKEVKAVSHSGEELFSFFTFKDPEQKIHNNIKSTILFSPQSVIACDRNNLLLYHSNGEKYEIDVYDMKGRQIRKINKPYDRTAISKKFRQDYKKNSWKRGDGARGKITFNSPKTAKTIDEKAQALMNSINSMKGIPMADYFPAVYKMYVGDNGYLWVETYDYKTETYEYKKETNINKTDNNIELTAFDIYDDNGFFITRAWLNISPRMTNIIRNGKFYNLQIDKDSGLRIVKRYSIKWKDR